MPQLRVDNYEVVLDAFWEGGNNADGSFRSILSEYKIQSFSGVHFTMDSQALLSVSTESPASPALVLQREMDVEILGYDRLVLSASLPRNVVVSVSARLDGKWKRVVPETHGEDTHTEFSGVLTGRRMSTVRIEVSVEARGTTPILLNWLLVENSAAISASRAQKPLLDAEWHGLLASNPRICEPQLELFFGRGELNRLRKKVRLGHLRPHFEALLAAADGMMKITASELVGRYAPGGDVARGVRSRDAAKPWLGAGVSDTLAFAGLMTGEPSYCRQAASCALALAHCEYWTHSFMGNLPGTTAHPRCFSESYILRAVAVVLDWCGDFLTPAGREIIRDAMVLKGLARVESDFHRWEYIRRMNQGLLFSPGRIYSYLALEKIYPRYRHRLLEAETDLKTMLRNYTLKDGGTTEGMCYWHGLGEGFPCLYALAKRSGKTFPEMMDKKLRLSGDFALEMLSTVGGGTEFFPINAAGQKPLHPSLMMAGAYLSATQDPRWARTYARLLESCGPDIGWAHLVMAPESISGSDRKVGVAKKSFYSFVEAGHAGIHHKGGSRGDIRFHYFSGPCGGGHSHQDKGSFILEANGEALAMDRGTTGYENPVHFLMSKSGWHNLAVPENEAGQPLEQDNKNAPGGRLIRAGFVGGVMDILSDNRKAWRAGVFKINRRRIWSPFSHAILVDDELVLNEPHSIGFRINVPYQPECMSSGSWLIRGRNAVLFVSPVNWTPATITAEEEGIDCRGHKIWILRMVSPKATKHRLLTLLEVATKSFASNRPVRKWNPASKQLVLWDSTRERSSIYTLQKSLAAVSAENPV